MKEKNLMVNSFECSTDIEQGQKGDFRSIYSPIDVREEADKRPIRKQPCRSTSTVLEPTYQGV